MQNKFLLFAIVLMLLAQSTLAYEGWDWSWDSWKDNVGDSLKDTFLFGWGAEDEPVAQPNIGWYPLQEWEYQACGLDLSTDVENVLNDVVSISGPRIYDLTITLSASKKVVVSDNTVLYEVGWYIRPKENEVEYDIFLANSDQSIKKMIKEDGKASFINGDAGFEPFYMDDQEEAYTLVILKHSRGEFISRIVEI